MPADNGPMQAGLARIRLRTQIDSLLQQELNDAIFTVLTSP
jgi:hypothetical protein